MTSRLKDPFRSASWLISGRRTARGRAGVFVAVALSCIWAPAPVSAAEEWVSQFRIYTPEAGAYRVGYEDLRAAGLVAETLPVAELDLRNQGSRVALWVADGGDGRFGPGDYFEFVATQLPGTESFVHEYATESVYRLGLSPEGGARMAFARSRPAVGEQVKTPTWRRQVHLEWDRLLIRLAAEQVEGVAWPETWFWEKLTHLDRQDLEIPLDLPGLAASDTETVEVAVHMRALSSQVEEAESELPDHRIDFTLGGRPAGYSEWDGRRRYLSRLEPVPSSALAGSEHLLSMKIPRRRLEAGADPVVDVVMLNWVEYSYPHDGVIGLEQLELRPAASSDEAFVLTSLEGRDLVAYGSSGARFELAGSVGGDVLDGREDESLWVVPRDALSKLARIELDAPSRLAATHQQADYLILAHGTLIESARRLADLHRAGGLEVALIDIQDVYDEFGHGIEHPRAIKKFIAHAYHHWREPRPRYVLLVGDASWDTKNATADDSLYANWVDRQLLVSRDFRAQKIETLGDIGFAGQRNLIPTFDYHTREGHAASDNWYVAVDGDDLLPDLAIGRLPVADRETLDGIVGKIVRYATETKVGPWRRNVLWITNEWAYLQDHTRSIEADLRPRGLAPTSIFPSSQEETNEDHQASLTTALNAGQLLVHFAGHGGRYIWRTGPRDLASKNYDLFTLAHVEALLPNDKLPVVFSVTCHSGPFDHPNADSIAEAFLRLPDRGAIAVVAASWRTSAASVKLSREMMGEFYRGGRIGDAFLRAKRNLEVEDLVATYNLLGDPALTLALPSGEVRLASENRLEGRVLALDMVGRAFDGRALVDFVDPDGNVVSSAEMAVGSLPTDVPWPEGFEAGLVRAYLWSEAQNSDALGTLAVGAEPEVRPGS